jgi:C-terminal processing protease CtpA/Prc
LNEAERKSVYWNVVGTTEKKFVDPKLNGVDLRALASAEEEAVIACTNSEEFEQRINSLLQKLGTSHIGFFHGVRPRSSGRIAIAATFTKAEGSDGTRWMFQDVHPGGVAARAGIRPGDVLLEVDGKEVAPPEATTFALGQRYVIVARRADGSTAQIAVDVPHSKEKSRPLVVPDQVVTARKLDGSIAYLRVSMFPGVLGMDVARDISRAIADLNCPRLIIDLRGNTGGGIGCLRLMSQMCADRRGVGYSVGRKLIENGIGKEKLPQFDKIPSGKLGVVPLIFRFALAGRSVAVFTESLGVKAHHGRVVLLVNEHSASACEMVAAFASEYGVATIVGTKTPGRLVAASSFKVGHGYRVALPVGAYFTWHGTKLEGKGVKPDVEEPVKVDCLVCGEDNQFKRAITLCSSL